MGPRHDIAIIGAGPAGLATACLSAKAGLKVALIDRQSAGALAEPAPDGRDIALTHRSVATLRKIGAWQRIDAEDVAPIRAASVRNGASSDLLLLSAAQAGCDALGVLVANSIIRKSLFEECRTHRDIELITDTAVSGLELAQDTACVELSSGKRIEAPLIVAADSRYSETRRMAGIGADMKDFGRVCIVCRMQNEQPHDETAHEWFDEDQTLAVLPLNRREVSIVLTVPSSAARSLMSSTPEAFAEDVARRLGAKWGRMVLRGDRHAYPLVAVYAHRFFSRRFVLIGDAAVGMHPVTAHGYNFGLRGAETLMQKIAKVREVGGDFGRDEVLSHYERAHRHATFPLYTATNAIVGLYTNNGSLARVARGALLRLGNAFNPVKSYLVHKLTEVDADRELAR